MHPIALVPPIPSKSIQRGGRMPLLVGSLAALVALAASILAGVHWSAALQRGGIALVVGWILGAIWSAVFLQLKPIRPGAEAARSGEEK